MLSGIELYPRWVPLIKCPNTRNIQYEYETTESRSTNRSNLTINVQYFVKYYTYVKADCEGRLIDL